MEVEGVGGCRRPLSGGLTSSSGCRLEERVGGGLEIFHFVDVVGFYFVDVYSIFLQPSFLSPPRTTLKPDLSLAVLVNDPTLKLPPALLLTKSKSVDKKNVGCAKSPPKHFPQTLPQTPPPKSCTTSPVINHVQLEPP